MGTNTSKLRGIYLQVKDIEQTVSFYKLLELDAEQVSGFYGRAAWPDGKSLEFGTLELTTSYDTSAVQMNSLSSNTIGIEFASDAKVDDIYAKVTEAGYDGHLAPCDPPWDARFAIVKDPDGNQIGPVFKNRKISVNRLPGGNTIRCNKVREIFSQVH